MKKVFYLIIALSIFSCTNQFDKSTADDKYSQIYFQGSQGNDFYDNTISNSTLPKKAKYGVWLKSDTKLNKVYNNTIDSESYRQSAIKDEGESNEIN